MCRERGGGKGRLPFLLARPNKYDMQRWTINKNASDSKTKQDLYIYLQLLTLSSIMNTNSPFFP